MSEPSDGRDRDLDDFVSLDDVDDVDVTDATDEGSLAATEEPDAEDAMLDSWADDADALGTEAGGFGPDRPRDARMPGLYSLGELDDVAAPGDVHDDDLTGQGQREG